MYLRELEEICVALDFYNKYIYKVEKLHGSRGIARSTIPKHELRGIRIS